MQVDRIERRHDHHQYGRREEDPESERRTEAQQELRLNGRSRRRGANARDVVTDISMIGRNRPLAPSMMAVRTGMPSPSF